MKETKTTGKIEEPVIVIETDKDAAIWRKGFEDGVKNAHKDKALAIGNAILNILDDRYEFKKEDYE